MNLNKKTTSVEVVITEHFDPQNLTPGGIDSIIQDIVKFAGEDTKFRIIGIATNNDIRLGDWTTINFAGRSVLYLPVTRLDRGRTKGIRGKIPHSLLFAAGLIRNRKKLPAADFHTHRIETGFIVLLISRGRLIQFIHNDSVGLLGARSDSTWRRVAKVYRFLENAVIKRADRMILFNKSDSARLLARRPDLIVSRTWFDSDVFSTAQDAQAPRKGGSADIDVTEICWVGRMDSQKDPLLALDVVVALKQQGVNPRLKMIGDGVLTNAIQSKIQDLGVSNEVEFLGSRSRIEVASIMSESQVLLMTSRYEGSPVVLLEAGASGLPVAATLESDPDHALIPGINGERISDRNASELAAAIRRCLGYSRESCRQVAESRSGHVSVPALMEMINQRPSC